MKTPTPLNAYASTPHKTITELEELATARTFAGENPADVKQDIIDGYGLGWQSANAALIETAADKGAEMECAKIHGGENAGLVRREPLGNQFNLLK